MVISKEAVVPSSDEPAKIFYSSKYEMVAHAPILEGGLRIVTFKIDMMKVWGMIFAIMRDLDFWTYVKSDQNTRNGIKS